MSMLAEKRQKRSWILNPRNTDWTNDSNKYGQKILEKMGWTPGKGLGVKEQGMVNALRIKYKNDFKGLGCEHKVEDWIKTQEEYNTILEELNDGVKHKKVGEKSLEKASKNIKSRVHYHKFTRGKDLSRYSAKDLESILGTNALFAEDTNKNKPEQKAVHGEYANFINKGVISINRPNNEKTQEKEMPLNENINSNDKINSIKKKNKKKRLKQTEAVDSNFAFENESTDSLTTPNKKRKKKRKL